MVESIRVKYADLALLLALAVLVVAYAATQWPWVGLLGLLALVGLVGRDVFTEKPKAAPSDKISILGLKLRIRWMLLLSALLSVAVAAFTSDIIRLFAIFLAAFNAIAYFEKRLGLAGWGIPEFSVTVAELDSAFYSALFVWLALGLVLNTNTPINVVTSCSMVPNLERGDLIFLQGGPIQAPQATLERPINVFSDFTKEPCSIRDKYTGNEISYACTTGLVANGKQIPFDHSGDIIVYEPGIPNGYDLIVHRVALIVTQNGTRRYLTKGDNNPVADLEGIVRQMPDDAHVKGKMIARIPYVGYLKLFLAFQFEEPNGCRKVLA